MNWPTLSGGDYVALLGLLGSALFTIFKMVQKIRTNDIHHLDKKIDEHNSSVLTSLNRIEGKMDGIDESFREHLRDHAAGMFK